MRCAQALVCALTMIGLGCAEARSDEGATKVVEVTMKDRSGRNVGTVRLQDSAHGVLMHAELSGLPPGEHAFHVHETGKCEPPFESAGAHLHRGDTKHGFQNPHGFHAGDLPNIHVSQSGTATVDVFANGLRLHDQVRILDDDHAALIIHAGADDYRTDPAGGAGDRIACGVIAPAADVPARAQNEE